MFRPYRQQALYISSRASLATRRRSIRIVWLGCLAASSSIVARLLRGERAEAFHLCVNRPERFVMGGEQGSGARRSGSSRRCWS